MIFTGASNQVSMKRKVKSSFRDIYEKIPKNYVFAPGQSSRWVSSSSPRREEEMAAFDCALVLPGSPGSLSPAQPERAPTWRLHLALSRLRNPDRRSDWSRAAGAAPEHEATQPNWEGT